MCGHVVCASEERESEHATWWVSVVMPSDCGSVFFQQHSLREPHSGRALGKVEGLPPTFTIQRDRTVHFVVLAIAMNGKSRRRTLTTHPFTAL